jgi:AraC-like DNA-binding protein
MADTDLEKNEWSRYYRLPVYDGAEVLHARFVTHRYARHSHDYLVIGLVENGAQAYWYRGARHVTPEARVFLVNPGESHTGESASADGYLYRTFCPHKELVARVSEELGVHYPVFFRGAVLNDPLLVGILAHFHRRLAAGAPLVEYETLIFEALAHLIVHHSEKTVIPKPVGREHPAIRRSREYLEAHFSQDVSLSELAATASISPFYLARAFKREIGVPPHVYLENVRIRKAREMLDGGGALAATALAVGYSDQSHFTRRFKRFLGITPGQYLREGKIRQDERYDPLTS